MSKQFRNVAIVAHVDHGKTTVVDAMLRHAGIYRDNQSPVDQAMDSNQLERERGITILSKNTSIQFDDIVINIVDTPGHHDFGGEVERVLRMVDGVLLVVDAAEGPMPQTTFVLKKALENKLTPVVLINKIDRPDARPLAVIDLVLDLFIQLGADEDQIEFPVIFGSARHQAMFADLPTLPLDTSVLREASVVPLLEALRDQIPAPTGDASFPLQMLVSNIDYDTFIGRLAIGRIEQGRVSKGQTIVFAKDLHAFKPGKVTSLLRFAGLEKEPVESAEAGDIVALAGLDEVSIGDTISVPDAPSVLPFTDIDEPTIAMTFHVNDTIYAGDESTYMTSRHLRDRLFREMETNVSLVVEATDSHDAFVVKGRGELHFSVLIETMRREGYAFMVSRPRVIIKEENGVRLEPEENVVIDVPADYIGIVMEKLGERRAELLNMFPPERELTRLEFTIPSRGLIGYRSQFMSDTKGTGVMSTMLGGYVPYKGTIETRNFGVLVATETGEATRYGLFHSASRGELLIEPGTLVYEGMIVGATQRSDDITVNVCKKKHVTNIRAAGADEALRLSPPLRLSLEQAMAFIADDELIEITPVTYRLRKRILDTGARQRELARRKQSEA